MPKAKHRRKPGGKAVSHPDLPLFDWAESIEQQDRADDTPAPRFWCDD